MASQAPLELAPLFESEYFAYQGSAAMASQAPLELATLFDPECCAYQGSAAVASQAQPLQLAYVFGVE